MAKKIAKKSGNTHRDIPKKSSKSSDHAKDTSTKHAPIHHEPRQESYKAGLLEVDKQEEKYDHLFEQKLAEQYKEFRNLKEHHIQIRKLIRIFAVVVTIILIALLVMTFS